MSLRHSVKTAAQRLLDRFDPSTRLMQIRDYETYRRTQQAGYAAKIAVTFVREANVRAIAEYASRRLPICSVLCPGTRNGSEQRFFRAALPDVTVLGTEIGDGAGQWPDTIEWDFHEIQPEWLGAWDLIYSNSWDHAFDPAKAFNAWVSCLRPEGLLVLEHSDQHTVRHTRELDPFGASLKGLRSYLDDVLSEHRVIDLLSLPESDKGQRAVIVGRK